MIEGEGEGEGEGERERERERERRDREGHHRTEVSLSHPNFGNDFPSLLPYAIY